MKKFKLFKTLLVLGVLMTSVSQMWAYDLTFRCIPKEIWGDYWTEGTNRLKCLCKDEWGNDKWNEMTYEGNDYNGYRIYSTKITDFGSDKAKEIKFQRMDKDYNYEYELSWGAERTGPQICGEIRTSSGWDSYKVDRYIKSGATVVWDMVDNSKNWSNTYMREENHNGSKRFSSAFTRAGTSSQWYMTYASDENINEKFRFFSNNTGVDIYYDDSQTTDITLTGNLTGVTLYSFINTKNGYDLNWQRTDDAKKAGSGKKFYFDNSDAKWSEIWLKYGTRYNNHSSAAKATKVTGTANLYVITMPNDAYYEKYYLANHYGYTNYYSIETMTNISDRIPYQPYNYSADTTFIPTANDGSTPKVWTVTKIAGHTHNVAITAPSHGTITVGYTDESGTAQSPTSGSFAVARTCNLTVSATPATGYNRTALTINSSPHTSGSVYIIKQNITVAATFTAKTYDVSLDSEGGSDGSSSVTLTYDSNSHASIENPTKTGYIFEGWYSGDDGEGDLIINTSGVLQANKDGYTGEGGIWKNDDSPAPTLHAKWTPITFTVQFDANGGDGEMADQDFTYDVSENLTANAFTKDGYYFEGWATTSAGEVAYRNRAEGCRISSTDDATVELFAKWKAISSVTSDCWDGNTYKCSEITDLATPKYSASATWSGATWGGGTPDENDQVVIPANMEITVNIAHAKAKEILLGASSTLTVSTNNGLEIAGAITKADGSAPTASDLILESTSSGNAALIFDNSNNAAATVQMYSKADISDASSASGWHWQYVGIPYKSVSALQYYGAYLYSWNGSGWSAVANGGTLTQFTGYCITSSSAETYTTSGELVTDKTYTATVTGKFAVVGNSWTAPIQIGQMENGDFAGADKTVYLFNTGNDVNQSGTVSEGTTAAGTYCSVPIAKAGKGGLPAKISALQGFYVTNSVTLDYDKHVRTTGTNTPSNGAMLAPKRVDNNESIMKVIAKGSRYAASVLFFENEDYTYGYDPGHDGKNINSAGAGPLIYTLREDGTKDAVSSIPSMEGAVVGFVKGEDNEYTMSFQYDGDEVWYLNDIQEQQSTLISEENTYVFTTTEKDDAERFVISATPIKKVPTDIDNVNGENVKARKQLIDGTLYIIRDSRIYNAEGAVVK